MNVKRKFNGWENNPFAFWTKKCYNRDITVLKKYFAL
jgi:hypothetical protein